MISLQTATARARLEARNKPHKASLDRGLTLGYRKPLSGAGTWVVIASNGSGRQWTETFGRADDTEAADGVYVLTYSQAAKKAAELARGRGNDVRAVSRPVTVDEALTNYEIELKARGGNRYNATTARYHLKSSDLMGTSLAAVTVKDLADWRLGLLTAGMKAPTLNRLLKSIHACFNLAAKHDERVAANASAWKRGLEFITGAAKARNAVLTLAQVRTLVAAAYALEEGFGIYVQAHAELGSRSDQIARITVGDVTGDRVMVPNSGKGRGKHKSRSGHTRRALAPGLAARFASLAKDRPADALLMTDANGAAWTTGERADRLFAKAREAAAIAPINGEDVTLIAFRHSSIVRMLERNIPIKAVATMHNTSAVIIETNYAKFLPHDDLDRAALVDTGPGNNVVPLAA
jgi:hypothetical protein